MTALDDAELARGLSLTAGEIHASAAHLAAMDAEETMDVVRGEMTNRISVTWRTGGWACIESVSVAHSRSARVASSASRTCIVFDRRRARWQWEPRRVRGWSRLGAERALACWRRRHLRGRPFYIGRHRRIGNLIVPRAVGYAAYGGKRWALSGGVSIARNFVRHSHDGSISPRSRRLASRCLAASIVRR